MNDAVAGRTLTVHCAGPGPAPCAADGSWTHAGARLRFATLDALRPRMAEFRALLDATERERMQRFRFVRDRDRFTLAHGWLRTLLGEELALPPDAVRFRRGPFGKPYVEGGAPSFNLSDTKDAVLVALGGAGEIGADVETMARTVDHAAVSAHYFTPEETADITLSVDPKRRFLELWTRKEAVLKASGVGIMDDLHVLRVNAALNTCTIAHPAFVRLAAPAYHVRTWHVGADHIVSLATVG
ncbi:MAG: 4'-phosphopantetheinyl transferase superfamily protein [Flavobacteriales bacterium]|jgi:phosphopantetheinyl transferase|nr:4'-phosphopantetheinyl transferase superfamily protein [Flavobacteriales bacterium]